MHNFSEDIRDWCTSNCTSENDVSKDADPEKTTVNIINLSKSVSQKSGSNLIISGLVPTKRVSYILKQR